MSSMTDVEKHIYTTLMDSTSHTHRNELYDWLNAHHFDYRGLIEKGLALEAPKELYNIS